MRALSPIAPSPPSSTPNTSPTKQKFLSLSFWPRLLPIKSPFGLNKRATLQNAATDITLCTFDDVSRAEETRESPLPEGDAAAMEGFRPVYEAESPDELALVDAASRYGCCLLQRDLHSVSVSLPGDLLFGLNTLVI